MTVLLAAVSMTALSGCSAIEQPSADPSTPSSSTSPSPSPTTDPYVGYFDTDMPEGGVVSNAGSFGAPGQVIAQSLHSESLAPGSYAVTIECAGAPEIDIWIAVDSAGARATAEPTTDLSCPGQVVLPAEIAVSALQVELGSRGETGAFRITVAPR